MTTAHRRSLVYDDALKELLPNDWSLVDDARGFLPGEISQLTEAVEKCVFTPILGSGCSRIGARTSADWQLLLAKIAWVRDALSETEKEYLNEFVREMRSDPPPEGVGAKLSETAVDQLLSAFQQELVRLLIAAETLVFRELPKSTPPVVHLTKLTVKVAVDGPADPKSESLRKATNDLRLRLFRLIRAANELLEFVASSQAKQELGPASDLEDLFGPAGILDTLVHISLYWFKVSQDDRGHLTTWEPTDANDREFLDKYRKRVRSLKLQSALAEAARKAGSNEPISVRLEWVEWLSNLLWHSFRWDSRICPSSAELAFQVQVCLDEQADAVRRPLSLAASSPRQARDAPGLLRKIFARCTPPIPESDKAQFLGAIVDALNRGLEKRLKDKRVVDPWPMALSTNYDIELERAFARAGKRCKILTPVLVTDKTTDTPTRTTVWILGILEPAGGGERVSEWQGVSGKLFADVFVDAPVIVKLHGSPCHEIKHARNAALTEEQRRSAAEYESEHGDEKYEIDHAIVLSEFDYVRDIVTGWRGLPEYLQNEIGSHKRVLVFLGQSVADWNIRLRLYRQSFVPLETRGTKGRAQGGKPTKTEYQPSLRWTINRDYDQVGTSTLARLGIRRRTAELVQLTDVIRKGSKRHG